MLQNRIWGPRLQSRTEAFEGSEVEGFRDFRVEGFKSLGVRVYKASGLRFRVQGLGFKV